MDPAKAQMVAELEIEMMTDLYNRSVSMIQSEMQRNDLTFSSALCFISRVDRKSRTHWNKREFRNWLLMALSEVPMRCFDHDHFLNVMNNLKSVDQLTWWIVPFFFFFLRFNFLFYNGIWVYMRPFCVPLLRSGSNYWILGHRGRHLLGML